MIVALAVLASGSLALLLREHFASRRAWDRPTWARSARGLGALRAAGWALLVGGTALLARASAVGAIVTAAIVLAAAAWTRWVRSAAYLARGLRREVERLRREHPDRDERELLRDVIRARHPRWGEDLADQIVVEQGDARRVAEMLVRMERRVGRGP